MIKINNQNRDLEILAEEHYEALKEFLIERVKFLISVAENSSSLKNLQKWQEIIINNYFALELNNQYQIYDFCQIIQDDNCDLLKEIMLSEPTQFKHSISKFTYNKKFIFKAREKKETQQWRLRNILYKIFDYDYFSTSKDYNAFQLCESLNIPVCPYCNRNYISILKDGKCKNTNGKQRELHPPLDHFYPKSKYPIFGLSFYNLIPCCTFCNSSLKRDKDFTVETHIHPYHEGFGENAKFCYKPSCSESLLGTYLNISQNASSTKTPNAICKKIENSDKVFEIEVLYQQNHQDIAEEIYDKSLANSEEYRESLFEIMGQLKPSLKEFYQFYFGNYMSEEDHEKRPLAKFTKDLVDDLGIMDKVLERNR